MRVNTQTGAYCCMAGCGARGGDVLAYHMAAHGLAFVDAAKALGAWIDDGRLPPSRPTRRNPARSLLGVASKPLVRAAWLKLAERFEPGRPLRKGRIALDGRNYRFELRADLSIVVVDAADGAIVAVSPPLIAMEVRSEL